MSLQMDINYDEFNKVLQGSISKIGLRAGSVTDEEAKEIMEESKKQVPQDTGALASTAFVDTSSSIASSTSTFGYTGEAVNPKTGESVADYMVAVHEDLDAVHPVGKAKFLEDPANDYASRAEASLGAKISHLISSILGR